MAPVKSIFECLEYGPALEGESLAKTWISKHGSHFGLFIDGSWQNSDGEATLMSRNVLNGEDLSMFTNATQADIDAAVTSSNQAFKTWRKVSHHAQSTVLYSIARNVQKHQSLLAVVEAIDTGKLAKETRRVDVPAVIRSFYHYAGWAALKGEELSAWKPIGVVCIIVDSSSPVMQLSIRIAAAMAMGNTVILQVVGGAPLSALLLVEICAQAGVPPGVLNVITGNSPEFLASHPGVNCLSFSGCQYLGQLLRQTSAGNGKQLSLELHGRNPCIILEEADIDSAVEGIVESAFNHSGQSNTCGSRLLIQEPIFDKVIKRLKVRMSKLTMGSNLDKNNDVGPLMDENEVESLKQMLSQIEMDGIEVFKPCPEPEYGNFISPTLITNLQTSSPVYVNEFRAPILVAIPFRTLKEGATIANHSKYGMTASVWTENISIAMEAASLLNAGTVWINCQNCRDAAAGVGGKKNNGYGRMGGREGLIEFAHPSFQEPVTASVLPTSQLKKFGSASAPSSLLPDTQATPGQGKSAGIDKTYKMFYGGAQKRADSNSYKTVHGSDGQVYAYVPDGGRKDIRNAVDAALKAAAGWKKKEGHGKAQIMYYMAENLQSQKLEIVTQLSTLTGRTKAQAAEEFEAAVQRLFYWAAWCDKYGGTVEETPMSGMTIKLNEPCGVVGIVCPDDYPLLAFVSLIAPAVARGNAVVVAPSGQFPVPGLAFHQILETSDVPAGVVNIVSGDNNVLTRTLTEHHDVSAMWYFGSDVGSQFVEFISVENFKRTWVNYGKPRDWLDAQQGQGEEFLYHSTNPKTVWIPMGDIFSN